MVISDPQVRHCKPNVVFFQETRAARARNGAGHWTIREGFQVPTTGQKPKQCHKPQQRFMIPWEKPRNDLDDVYKMFMNIFYHDHQSCLLDGMVYDEVYHIV